MNQTHQNILKKQEKVQIIDQIGDEVPKKEQSPEKKNQNQNDINLDTLPPKQQNQKEQAKKQVWNGNWSTKMIAFITFLILLVIGLIIGFAIVFSLRYKPRITSVQPSKKIDFDDGSSVIMTPMVLEDKNLFENNTKISFIKTQVVIAKGRRMLQSQQKESNFYTTVEFKQLGMIAQVQEDNSAKILIDPILFTNYLISIDQEAARILQEIENGTTNGNDSDWKEFEKELSSALSQQLNSGSPIDLQYQSYVTFTLNNSTKQFEEDKNSQNKIRILQQRRLLTKFFRKIMKKIVKKTVKPAVQVLRKNGPLIGKVVGGAIGLIILGPQGAQVLSQVGERFGRAAQIFINACIPEGTQKITCNVKLVANAVGNQAVNQIKQYITGRFQPQ